MRRQAFVSIACVEGTLRDIVLEARAVCEWFSADASLEFLDATNIEIT
jgi:hypothetical protein